MEWVVGVVAVGVVLFLTWRVGRARRAGRVARVRSAQPVGSATDLPGVHHPVATGPEHPLGSDRYVDPFFTGDVSSRPRNGVPGRAGTSGGTFGYTSGFWGDGGGSSGDCGGGGGGGD